MEGKVQPENQLEEPLGVGGCVYVADVRYSAVCLLVPVSTPGTNTFTGPGLGWPRIINQIKCFHGILLLMYISAALLRVKTAALSFLRWLREPDFMTDDTVQPWFSATSESRRPINHHCLAVFYIHLKASRDSRKTEANEELKKKLRRV